MYRILNNNKGFSFRRLLDTISKVEILHYQFIVTSLYPALHHTSLRMDTSILLQTANSIIQAFLFCMHRCPIQSRM